MLALIPYTTFPDFSIGPLTIRTFGTLVGIGVLLGAWLAARYVERFGIPREETYRLATRLIVGGVIGSRVTWVLSHPEEIDSPIDLIAVWEGGIQFSGGFIAAVVIGMPTFMKWGRGLRWRSLDGYAYGLTVGLAIGRVGCYSVGEHFGSATSFVLGTRYDGGSTQEDFLGDVPLVTGTVFHQTALYEFFHLTVLFGIMSFLLWKRRRRGEDVKAGTIMGIFLVWYGVMRFATDALRVNDSRVAGLTGAQWMSLALVPIGLWVLFRVRHLIADTPVDEDEVAEIQARVLAKAGRSALPPDGSGAETVEDADAPASPVQTPDVTDGDVNADVDVDVDVVD